MPKNKRATIYLEPELHKVLRLKAAVSEKPISYLVNEAVRLSLGEDAEDLASFEQRRKEPDLDFETVIKDMKKRGKL